MNAVRAPEERVEENTTRVEDQLIRSVARAADRAEVREAVRAIYDELQAETDERRPRCDASGRCCRFEAFGHRLYVTTAELAAFSYELTGDVFAASRSDVGGPAAPRSRSLPVLADSAGGRDAGATPEEKAAWDGTGCPYQVRGLCGVHSIRPFGCRVFFCDESSTEWQRQAYERFHGRLKRAHERLDVPYFYVEWRSALRILGLTASTAPPVRLAGASIVENCSI